MEETPRVQQQEIRSAEVQEIISQVPNSIVRWGMSVLFIVLTSLLSITWFIQYPDVLPASVTITTTPAPSILVSRQGGSLMLLKADNDSVYANETVAYLKSNADVTAILTLENALLHDEELNPNKGANLLGDLQGAYFDVIKAETALYNFLYNHSHDILVKQLNRQLDTYTKLNVSLQHQELLAEQELMLANKRFKTDSVLFTKQVLSPLDYNNAKTTWLQQQRAARNAETAIFNNEVQLNELRKQLADAEIQKQEQHQRLEQEVINTRQSLLAQVVTWKERHLFIAPSVGRVNYLGFFENEMYVEASRNLFVITPTEGKLVAHAELPVQNSGKVKQGQFVNIRLDNYPHEQYGMLRGTVSAVSAMPTEGKYRLTLELPQNLVTTQKRKLEFRQQLTGTTEIITEDLRLLERFFYQFRKLVTPVK